MAATGAARPATRLSAFADSSALVKLYADEDGHVAVRALEAIAVSALARVEVPGALWRKQRLGELRADDARILTQAFEADYYGSDSEPPRFAAVDGIQLAAALAARSADSGCDSFACFDESLRDAAATRGFTLVP